MTRYQTTYLTYCFHFLIKFKKLKYNYITSLLAFLPVNPCHTPNCSLSSWWTLFLWHCYMHKQKQSTSWVRLVWLACMTPGLTTLFWDKLSVRREDNSSLSISFENKHSNTYGCFAGYWELSNAFPHLMVWCSGAGRSGYSHGHRGCQFKDAPRFRLMFLLVDRTAPTLSQHSSSNGAHGRHEEKLLHGAYRKKFHPSISKLCLWQISVFM